MPLMKKEKNRVSLSGKMFRAYSIQKIMHLDVFWERLPEKVASLSLQGDDGATLVVCLDHKGQSLGESSMPNISEWPNAADVCLLSQVLEKDSIPQKFYLSGKACAGILRRAETRGKTLPEALEKALTLQAENPPLPL